MNREQFEKLEEVSCRLVDCEKYGGIVYSFEHNLYLRGSMHCMLPSPCEYINGAWYAWQEQQKKIDLALKYLEAMPSIYKTLNYESGIEVLKGELK